MATQLNLSILVPFHYVYVYKQVSCQTRSYKGVTATLCIPEASQDRLSYLHVYVHIPFLKLNTSIGYIHDYIHDSDWHLQLLTVWGFRVHASKADLRSLALQCSEVRRLLHSLAVCTGTDPPCCMANMYSPYGSYTTCATALLHMCEGLCCCQANNRHMLPA